MSGDSTSGYNPIRWMRARISSREVERQLRDSPTRAEILGEAGDPIFLGNDIVIRFSLFLPISVPSRLLPDPRAL
jgi:hypothetical protein